MHAHNMYDSCSKFDVFVDEKNVELRLQREAELDDKADVSANATAAKLTKEEVLKKFVKDWLEQNKIFGFMCLSVDNGRRKHVSFHALKCYADEIYYQMKYSGFGDPGSKTIMMVNNSEYCEGASSDRANDDKGSADGSLTKTLMQVQAKMTVHEVLANIRKKGRISREPVFQLIVASIFAIIGLAMNDMPILISSMFVAPFMDSINLMTFAIRIRSWDDLLIGLKTNLIYKTMMLAAGIILYLPIFYLAKTSGGDDFIYPTKVMTDRGTPMSVVVAGILATVSTFSSYSSMLNGGQMSVLIANAISLSLVPPFINSVQLLIHGLRISIYFSGATNNATDPCLQLLATCANAKRSPNFNLTLSACKVDNELIGSLLRSWTFPSDAPSICGFPTNLFFMALCSFLIPLVTEILVTTLGQLFIWMHKFTPQRLDKQHVTDFYRRDIDEYATTNHSTIRPSNQSEACFIESLREALRDKSLTESDCDFALYMARQSEHYQTIVTSSAPNPAVFPLLRRKEDMAPNLRCRHLPSRQMSENQRTIRSIYMPEKDNVETDYKVPTTFRVEAVVPGQNFESTPLHPSASVGRFEISEPTSTVNNKLNMT